MICYFGRDEFGYYVDHDTSSRVYVPESLWRELIAAGAHAGVDTQGADVPGGERVKLSITQQARVDKYEGDVLIESIEGTPESTLLFS